MARKLSERTFVTSVNLPISYDTALQKIIDREGGSFTEHVRIAMKDYLLKKGELKN